MSAEHPRRAVIACHQADAHGHAEGGATIAVFRQQGRAVMATGASWLTAVRLTNAEAVQLVSALLTLSGVNQQDMTEVIRRYWAADRPMSAERARITCRVADSNQPATVTVFHQHDHVIMVTKSHWTTAVRLTTDETVKLVSGLLMAAGTDRS